MPGTVELVLAVEATTASEWMAGPVPAEGAGRAAGRAATSADASTSRARKQHADASGGATCAPVQAQAGKAIADALRRMPGIAEVSTVEPLTVRAFVEPEGNWWIMLAAAGDGACRVTAALAEELIPGVRRYETVYDAPLEAGTSLVFDDAVPQAVKDALGKADKLVSSPALAVRRGVWRWTGPDGAVVDIELHDARAASDSADRAALELSSEHAESTPVGKARMGERGSSPIAFCELRLTSRIDEEQCSVGREAGSPRTVAEGKQARAGEQSAAESEAQAKQAASVAALAALFAAASVLTDTLPVFPSLTDGYRRACLPGTDEVPVRAARVDLHDAKTPHGALLDVAANVARQWFGNEAGVRGSAGTDAEFVHQMRVALRRLKTLLKTFPRWADDTWKRTIAPDLDWLGVLLGLARDLDVFVESTLPMLVAADVDAAAWAPLQARASARRDEARARVRAALRTRRYALLSLAWLHWLATQHFSQGPSAMADKPLAAYAAKRVRKHYRRLLEKPGLTALTPAERHRRRIEAKRLRYTLEFFHSLASGKARRRIAKQLGRIQSVLGDGSDATAALRFLEALDVPPYQHGFARGWCEAVNRWSAIEGERLLQELDKPKIVRAS